MRTWVGGRGLKGATQALTGTQRQMGKARAQHELSNRWVGVLKHAGAGGARVARRAWHGRRWDEAREVTHTNIETYTHHAGGTREEEST